MTNDEQQSHAERKARAKHATIEERKTRWILISLARTKELSGRNETTSHKGKLTPAQSREM